MRHIDVLSTVKIDRETFKVSKEKAEKILAIIREEELVDAADVLPILKDAKKRAGIIIRGLRRRNNLTQTQMAGLLDIKQSNLSAIETGRRVVGRELAMKIAREFKIDYRRLL